MSTYSFKQKNIIVDVTGFDVSEALEKLNGEYRLFHESIDGPGCVQRIVFELEPFTIEHLLYAYDEAGEELSVQDIKDSY